MQLQHGPQAVIAASASLSGAIDLKDFGLVAIQMPSSWTTANLTFQGSDDPNGTYQDVYDSGGTEVTVTAAAGRYIILSPVVFAGLRYLKIRSGTTGSAVTQNSARTLQTLVRRLA